MVTICETESLNVSTGLRSNLDLILSISYSQALQENLIIWNRNPIQDFDNYSMDFHVKLKLSDNYFI